MKLKQYICKKNIYLLFNAIFFLLTIIGAILCIYNKVDNAGYAVIPMLFTIIFARLYQDSKKENKKKNNN